MNYKHELKIQAVNIEHIHNSIYFQLYIIESKYNKVYSIILALLLHGKDNK